MVLFCFPLCKPKLEPGVVLHIFVLVFCFVLTEMLCSFPLRAGKRDMLITPKWEAKPFRGSSSVFGRKNLSEGRGQP